jgi:hypothetical protein
VTRVKISNSPKVNNKYQNHRTFVIFFVSFDVIIIIRSVKTFATRFCRPFVVELKVDINPPDDNGAAVTTTYSSVILPTATTPTANARINNSSRSVNSKIGSSSSSSSTAIMKKKGKRAKNKESNQAAAAAMMMKVAPVPAMAVTTKVLVVSCEDAVDQRNLENHLAACIDACNNSFGENAKKLRKEVNVGRLTGQRVSND